MRILLVKPQAHLRTVLGLQRFQCLEPLEFGYLAAAIPEQHEVRVLDLRLYRFADAAFERALARFRPELVGFTAYSHESGTMKRLAGTVRRLLPNTRIVVGGHHATVAPADCNIPDIDYIVRGEGCAPFGALVAALDRGDEPEGIANLLCTGDRFDASAASVWPRYPDPRTIPIPRRDLWDSRPYSCIWVHENPRDWQVLFPPVAMARTSYGCKMTCSFCIVPFLSGTTHMPRLVDVVAEDIARIAVDHVYFADDENFIDERFGFELAEALERRGVKKRYFAWARATTILRYPELLRRWKEIGLDGVFVGFEFVTNQELKATHKGGTVAHNERAHDTLRRLGIACHAAFMVRPEYGHAEFRRLRDYVNAMPPAQYSFTVCTPSPGTPDYEAARPAFWCGDAYDLHDCMHPLTPTTLPLREFAALLARQIHEAGRRHPLRVERHLTRPWELARIVNADWRYQQAFRELYRDYPRELWDWPGDVRMTA
ncbi:MAG: cobalamin-dependent protein [Candidatus Competibacter phosphatis]